MCDLEKVDDCGSAIEIELVLSRTSVTRGLPLDGLDTSQFVFDNDAAT